MKPVYLSVLLVILDLSVRPPNANAAVSSGSAVVWGETFYESPSVRNALTNVIAISGKSVHFRVALRADGTVIGWGSGGLGQLDFSPNLTNIIAVAAGAAQSLFLQSNGTVLGFGSLAGAESTPPAGLNDVIAIAAGSYHSLALKSDGTIVSWGQSIGPQPALSDATAIAAGGSHALAIRSNGTVIAWGDNQYGQSTVPSGLSNVVAIAGGYQHSAALLGNGSVVVWGSNEFGQLNKPSEASNIVAITCGTVHTVALRQDGRVLAWGGSLAGETDVPQQYATNCVGVAATATTSFALTKMPVIVLQPASTNILAGGTLDLSIFTIGPGPVDFQWVRDGEDLTAATKSAFRLENIQPPAAGRYSIIIRNGYGNVRSDDALVVVRDSPPIISVQPASTNVLAGMTATFETEARGSEPLHYQWQFNGADLTDATNSTVSLTGVQLINDGEYSVTITNTFGVVQSTIARLFVNVPARIVRQPRSQTVSAGQAVSFEVFADGTPPFRYQWRFEGTNITGATNSLFQIQDPQAAHQGRYDVVVTNEYGITTSETAVLTVEPSPPTIAEEPQSRVTQVGAKLTFSVRAVGTEPLSYKWQFNETDLGSGATNSTLSVSNVNSNNIGSYRVIVRNGLGETTSDPAMLSLYKPPTDQVDWPQLTFNQIGTNRFETPNHITHAGDGSQRIFVVEKRGTIRILLGSNVVAEEFLDVRDRVDNFGGLLSVAFPQDFKINREFYTSYQRKADHAIVVSRFSLATNAWTADPLSEEVLLQISQPQPYLNGEHIVFGPDGYLYVAVGDLGFSSDSEDHAQNPMSLLGKMLRINVRKGIPTYEIPPGNPYSDDSAYRPEIWALGLQNPWGFSFDRATHDLYIGDWSIWGYQEINFQAALSSGGQNYGWWLLEGPALPPQPPDPNLPEFTDPVTWYSSTEGRSVVGGFVYRGPDFPRMNGIYVFADFDSGQVFGLRRFGTNWLRAVIGSAQRIDSFGEDEEGYLYAANYFSGAIYRVEDSFVAHPPTLNPASRTFDSEGSVKVDCLTPDAVIRYTFEGRDPIESDPAVRRGESILVKSNLTLKARAFRSDLRPSVVVSGSYTLFVGLRVEPTGPITNGTTVRIIPSTGGTTIQYTTDGSDPDASSSTYTGPLVLNANTTLKAQGFKPGFNSSSIISQFFGLLDYENVVVRTIAGNGTHGYRDGVGTNAQFFQPEGICVDAAGNLYVADRYNHRIRKVSPDGHVSTLAGSGNPGFQDGPVASAMFSSPIGIAIDSSGSLYVADRDNQRIRRIDSSGVSTYAGNGVRDAVDGDRLNASFVDLGHLDFNSLGNLFVGDFARLRMISRDGLVSTPAGTGVYCCGWSGEIGVGLDASGKVYIAINEGLVRFIDLAGGDTVYAGSEPGHADGPRLTARFSGGLYFNQPIARDLSGDSEGNLYVNDKNWIRKITPNGLVRTLVPIARFGLAPPPLSFAAGLCVDSVGNIYVTDIGTATIKKISPDVDFDGVPDSEEGGSTPYVVGRDDRFVDTDGDGASDASEYVAGTDPKDPQSVLRLEVAPPKENRLLVTWPSTPRRIYQLQSSTDLLNWTNQSTSWTGTGLPLSYDAEVTGSRFFRVEATTP